MPRAGAPKAMCRRAGRPFKIFKSHKNSPSYFEKFLLAKGKQL